MEDSIKSGALSPRFLANQKAAFPSFHQLEDYHIILVLPVSAKASALRNTLPVWAEANILKSSLMNKIILFWLWECFLYTCLIKKYVTFIHKFLFIWFVFLYWPPLSRDEAVLRRGRRLLVPGPVTGAANLQPSSVLFSRSGPFRGSPPR